MHRRDSALRALILICLAVIAWRALLRPWPAVAIMESDFAAYHQAAQALADHRSPYASPGYLYPALLAGLLTPLAGLELIAARRAWLVFGALGLIVSCALLSRWLAKSSPHRPLLAKVPWLGAALIGTIEANQVLGQIQVLLLPLLAGALVLERRSGIAGTLIGAAAALKLWPASLAAVEFGNKKLRLAVFAVGAFLILGWLPTNLVQRLDGPKRPSSIDFIAGSPAVLNASASGIALRALSAPPPSSAELPSSWHRAGGHLQTLELPTTHRRVGVATSFIGLVIGLVFGWFGGPLRRRESAYAWLLLLSLLVVPVSWYHYRLLHLLTITLVFALLPAVRATAASVALLASSWTPVWLVAPYYDSWGWSAEHPLLLQLAAAAPAVAEVFVMILLYLSVRPSGKTSI